LVLLNLTQTPMPFGTWGRATPSTGNWKRDEGYPRRSGKLGYFAPAHHMLQRGKHIISDIAVI